MRPVYLYIIENNINGKLYIGITINPRIRWNAHKSGRGCPALHRAMKKHGVENFALTVVRKYKDRKSAEEAEIMMIRELDTIKNGYNILTGGYVNDAAIAALKKPIICEQTGKIYPSIVEAAEDLGTKCYSVGFVLAGRQETVAGKYSFKYVEDKLNRKADKRRKERKRNVNPNDKPIICENTGVKYRSISAAAIDTGVSRHNIQACVLGITDHAGGLTFNYLNKNLNKKTKTIRRERKIARDSKYAVICLNTGKEFKNSTEAGKYYKCSPNTISQAIALNKTTRKGLKFKRK